MNYMYDIVLEISFLDINIGPNLSPSNLKLLQKSVKIQYIFQKFLRMANRHDEANFLIEKIFGSGPFLIFFHLWWIKKMTRAKKVTKVKNQFFHACQPRLRPYFHNCLPNLWAAICEWWSISQKTFLVKNHFKWSDLQVVWCGKKSDNLRATLPNRVREFF